MCMAVVRCSYVSQPGKAYYQAFDKLTLAGVVSSFHFFQLHELPDTLPNNLVGASRPVARLQSCASFAVT